jgi:predicted nucleotidyltransferase
MARAEPGVCAIALVGSCARGTPGPDSDIDLVVLTTDQGDLGGRTDWFAHFGSVQLVRQRQFGDVAERRLRRRDGVEIEVGLAPLAWAATDPVDPGTLRVVRDGFSIVLDPDGTLAGLAGAVKDTG